MTTITYIQKDGSPRTVEAAPGANVMETAIVNNIRGIDGECGGCCSCATCHVYVDETWLARLPAPDDMEQEMLEAVAAERRATSRLGCQIVISDALAGLVIAIPEHQ
jgi:2Fe-2S ferredoxin